MPDLNEGRFDLPRSRTRFVAFGLAAVLVFSVLTARLFQLQVVEGVAYAARAQAARSVEVPIRAPRGLIFDRNGMPLAVNAASWTVKARPADLPGAGWRRELVLATVARLTGVPAAALQGRVTAFRGSPFELVPLVRDVDRPTALLLGEAAAQLPGIAVEVEPVRQYLDETGAVNGQLLAQVLGYTGPVSAAELSELAGDGYLRDDVLGKNGVEASYEALLRGTYGSQLVERDASGRPTKVIDVIANPVPGRNLMLTIDAEMQRVATESLRWGLAASGVQQGVMIVMNPHTGEILSMVSLPTYDNNLFATGISAGDYQVYLTDPAKPLRNHAIADIYPPGSTFKLVTALAALQEGVTTPSRRWPTYACYQIPGAPAGQCLRDWNRRGFGPLNVVEAFAKSSDTFFYQMAIGAGLDGMGRWAGELGFGTRSGIRLPAEAPGIVLSRQWAQAQGRPDVYTGELAQAGIGQNVIAVTPLQLLNAYATLANGGHLYRPMIVRGEADAGGALLDAYEPELIRDLAADADNLRTIRIGARNVITTGHAWNINQLRLPGALSGKTGTAEFGATPTGQGVLPFHSWFVAWLPSQAGATDAELAVITFTYSAVVHGNVALEVTKYFLQQWYGLDQDLRYDPAVFGWREAY